MKYYVQLGDRRRLQEQVIVGRPDTLPPRNADHHTPDYAERFLISLGTAGDCAHVLAAAVVDLAGAAGEGELIASYPLPNLRLPEDVFPRLLSGLGDCNENGDVQVEQAIGKSLHDLAQRHLNTLGIRLAPRSRSRSASVAKTDEKHIRTIEARAKSRVGQGEFRAELLRVYGGACAISGCKVEASLSAAHIFDYSNSECQEVWNGILLRADIHLLFDRHMLRIFPGIPPIVVLDGRLRESKTYGRFHERGLRLPMEFNEVRTNAELRRRWDAANKVIPGFQPPGPSKKGQK